MNPRSETWCRGSVASRGLALGATSVERELAQRHREAGTPVEERAALAASIDSARASLDRLMAAADDMAAGILEFQVSLLDDDELTGPVYAAVDRGEPADAAWCASLDAQIADYEAADDDYFRARASDLDDLRDRVLRGLLGQSGPAGSAADVAPIYVGRDLSPSRFLEIDWTHYAGAALTGGSAASHVAMLARARGVPMVIGLDADLETLADGAAAILDATEGWLVLDPAADTRRRFDATVDAAAATAAAEAAYLDKPAATARGEPVAVLLNVDDPALLARVEPGHCDGIGLARTEFLFHDAMPDEDAQYAVYAELVRWAGGRPVTIRTLDAGGDKPVPGYTPTDETNPFLGARGLRLSLAHPDIFAVQLRALARAAALGPVKVMCPMVTRPEEMARTRRLLVDAVQALEGAGVACARPPLGMMVEVPSAALRAAAFAVDFYSIGSNDLVQYVTATARDNAAVADLHDATDPAVLELIERTVAAGREHGREVSLCGDMGGTPEQVPALLATGLRAISVAPAALARTKAAIARWDG